MEHAMGYVLVEERENPLQSVAFQRVLEVLAGSRYSNLACSSADMDIEHSTSTIFNHFKERQLAGKPQ
ncbi:MAG: hypothetical protein ACRCXC_03800 [Legionella sp.]